jgi:hypothetical protein
MRRSALLGPVICLIDPAASQLASFTVFSSRLAEVTARLVMLALSASGALKRLPSNFRTAPRRVPPDPLAWAESRRQRFVHGRIYRVQRFQPFERDGGNTVVYVNQHPLVDLGHGSGSTGWKTMTTLGSDLAAFKGHPSLAAGRIPSPQIEFFAAFVGRSAAVLARSAFSPGPPSSRPMHGVRSSCIVMSTTWDHCDREITAATVPVATKLR